MSRTYRKPRPSIESNVESYIKHSLSRRYNRWDGSFVYETRTVKRKKPQEVYKAEYDAAWKEYHAKLKKASYDEEGRPYDGRRWGYNCGKYGLVPNYIHEPYVSRYHRIKIPWSLEQEIVELRKEYARFSRDGHWSETSQKTGFKKAAANSIRRANKRLERDVMKEEDYDRLPYPDQHEGDYLVWSFW